VRDLSEQAKEKKKEGQEIISFACEDQQSKAETERYVPLLPSSGDLRRDLHDWWLKKGNKRVVKLTSSNFDFWQETCLF